MHTNTGQLQNKVGLVSHKIFAITGKRCLNKYLRTFVKCKIKLVKLVVQKLDQDGDGIICLEEWLSVCRYCHCIEPHCTVNCRQDPAIQQSLRSCDNIRI